MWWRSSNNTWIYGIPRTSYIMLLSSQKQKLVKKKWVLALAKLAEEDPTFKTYTDEETGQTIIAGMGELTLRNHRW